MNDLERLDELEKRVEAQVRELYLLRVEISELRRRVLPQAGDEAIHETSLPTSNSPSKIQVDRSTSGQSTAQPDPVDWEHLIGRVWLPRIFIFVLLLGVIWGFNAAISAGLLTKPVRILIGYIASGILLWLGDRQMKAGRGALGQVLLGGTVSLLLITTFAGNSLYKLIPSVFAFPLDVLIIALGVFLSIWHRSEALAILSTVGGYLVPYLVESSSPSTLFFVSYEVVMSVSFLVLAIRNRYEKLYFIAVPLFHLPLFAFSIMNGKADDLILAIGVLLHHAAVTGFFVSGWNTNKHHAIMVYSTAALTVGWWFMLYQNSDPDIYHGFLLAFSIIYAAVAYWRRHKQIELAVYISISALSSMLYLLEMLTGTSEALALLLEGTALLALAAALRAKLQLLTGSVLYIFGAAMALSHEIVKIISLPTVSWLLVIVTLAFIYRLSPRFADAATGWTDGETYGQTAEAAARTDLIASLRKFIGLGETALILVFLTMVTQIAAEPLTRDGEHLAVSAVWAVYSISVIAIGMLRNIRMARLVGVILLFGTLLKLILVDLPTVSVWVRAVLFIGLGVIGLGISRLFYRRK